MEAPKARPKRRVARRQSVPESFARFWAVWPRKVAKADAERAWAKLAPDPDMEARILAAVSAQKAGSDWQRDDGRFIPHPATWLNGRRWEDEMAATGGPTVELTELDVPEARREEFFQMVVKYPDAGLGYSANGCPVVSSGGSEWRRFPSGRMEPHYGPRYARNGKRIV